jgi:hypothetical protein
MLHNSQHSQELQECAICRTLFLMPSTVSSKQLPRPSTLAAPALCPQCSALWKRASQRKREEVRALADWRAARNVVPCGYCIACVVTKAVAQ